MAEQTAVIPFEKIEAKYAADCEKIRGLRAKADEVAAPFMEEIAKIEKYQKAREDYIFEHLGVEAFKFVVALYLNGRDDKAVAKKQAENVGIDMKKMEAWLLKQLAKVGNSISTDFGTVYKTRKESVGVADFDAYLDSEILRPAALTIVNDFRLAGDSPDEEQFAAVVSQVMEAIKSNAHLEALTKAANKTYVLEIMGDKDEKTEARPNPPPPGIDYKAFATVGVRKSPK